LIWKGINNVTINYIKMTSRERILCAINGLPGDHIPLTTWCFGFQPPPHLRWISDDNEIDYWYTKRLEHIHTLPQPWILI